MPALKILVMHGIMTGLVHAAIRAAAGLLYGASAYRAGDLTVKHFDPPFIRPFVCIAAGAALYSFIFSALALLGLTNAMIAIALSAVILATLLPRLRIGQLRVNIGPIPPALSIEWLWKCSLWAILLVYLAYGATFSLTPFFGADLGIYHLVIPRETLREGGFVFNPFFLAEGFPRGWHMFGLPAYALAGPAGYLSLSLFCFGLTLVLAFRTSKMLFEESSSIGLVSAVVVAFIVGTNELGSISNNDVPVLFIELIALLIAAQTPPSRRAALVLGLLCGFAVAIKPMVVAGVVLILALWLYRQASLRARLEALAIFSASFVPPAVFWPVVTLWHSGSPLPQLMNGPRLWGSALPAFAQTTAMYSDLFDKWMTANWARFISGRMVGNALLLSLLVAGLLFAPRRIRQVALFLVAFAIGRILLLAMIFGRPTFALSHDRYNLVSFVLIGLAAVWSSYAALLKFKIAAPVAGGVLGSLIGLIAVIGLAARWTLKDPTIDGSITASQVPSMLEQMAAQIRSLGKPPQLDPITEYVRRETPKEAVVATTSVSPFELNRRFMQVLPISQNVIDLDRTPAEIEQALRTAGACYLHVPYSTGLNPWMNIAVSPWIDRVRQVCDRPGATILRQHNPATGSGLLSTICKLPNC
jgi:hypothetical protein